MMIKIGELSLTVVQIMTIWPGNYDGLVTIASRIRWHLVAMEGIPFRCARYMRAHSIVPVLVLSLSTKLCLPGTEALRGDTVSAP